MTIHRCSDKDRPAAPSPEQIKAARVTAGLTMGQAAALVHRNEYRRWSEWENGHVRMPAAEWELFQLKTKKVVDSNVNKK